MKSCNINNQLLQGEGNLGKNTFFCSNCALSCRWRTYRTQKLARGKSLKQLLLKGIGSRDAVITEITGV
jgi:organic radical activating enzyme